MRILFTDTVSNSGGAQRSMLDTCVGLRSQNIEVVAATPPGWLSEQLVSAGIQVCPIKPLRATRRSTGLFSTAVKLAKAPASFSHIIRSTKPDIIHANSLTTLLAIGRSHRHTPLVWHVRDLQMPVIPAQEAGKNASLIIAVSKAVDEWLSEHLSPRVLSKIRVLHNGIDTAPFQTLTHLKACNRFNLKPEYPIIGMVGHFVPWKRHDLFLHIAHLIQSAIPEAQFVIAGQDLFNEHHHLMADLKNLAHELQLTDKLHWITSCNSMAELMPAFDLLLHPPSQEAFGRVLIEAMAAKVPVIATLAGGSLDIIEHNVTGILTPPEDYKKMASEAVNLLQNNATAESIKAQALKRVEENFNIAEKCAKLAELYRNLVNK